MIINNQNTEGATAKAIEEQTSKLPSDLFLYASLAAMGTSLTLKCLGKSNNALFVGQWAAPFLLLGIYNKLVKLEGHDAQDKNVNQDVNIMEKQKNDNTDNEEFKDTDQGFNARNQYSGSGNFSKDEQQESDRPEGNLESSLNNDKPDSPTDLQQDKSGNLKSNN